jgi:hypothetical protein
MIRKGLLAAAPLLAALIVTLGATRAYAIPKFVETGQPQDITAGLMGNVGNIQVLFTSNPGDVEGDDALDVHFSCQWQVPDRRRHRERRRVVP